MCYIEPIHGLYLNTKSAEASMDKREIEPIHGLYLNEYRVVAKTHMSH